MQRCILHWVVVKNSSLGLMIAPCNSPLQKVTALGISPLRLPNRPPKSRRIQWFVGCWCRRKRYIGHETSLVSSRPEPEKHPTQHTCIQPSLALPYHLALRTIKIGVVVSKQHREVTVVCARIQTRNVIAQIRGCFYRTVIKTGLHVGCAGNSSRTRGNNKWLANVTGQIKAE
jgi:hypothetical protein